MFVHGLEDQVIRNLEGNLLAITIVIIMWNQLSTYRNYAPTVKIQQEALDKGCDQVLWLLGDKQQVSISKHSKSSCHSAVYKFSQITEVGTMNVFVHWVNEDGSMYLRMLLTKLEVSVFRTWNCHTWTWWNHLVRNNSNVCIGVSQEMGMIWMNCIEDSCNLSIIKGTHIVVEKFITMGDVEKALEENRVK